MITATFNTKNQRINAVTVSGHADFSDYGSDIVCAAVTSAVVLCANGITEIIKQKADVTVEENLVEITLGENPQENAENFLAALMLHLENLKQDYPKNIKIITTEV